MVLAVIAALVACGSVSAQDTAPAPEPASAPASAPAPAAGSSSGARVPPRIASRPRRRGSASRSAGSGLLPDRRLGGAELPRPRRPTARADNDLYGYLSLDGGNPDVDDALFHFIGRVTYDFDGDATDPGDPFYSLNDLSGSLDSHLYEGFVDLRTNLVPAGFGLNRIRLGRQDLYAAFTYLVDGVRIDFEPVKSCGIPASQRLRRDPGVPVRGLARGRLDRRLRRDVQALARRPHDRPLRATSRTRPSGSGNNVNNYASIALWQRVNDDSSTSGPTGTRSTPARGTRRSGSTGSICATTSRSTARYRYQSTITNEYTTPYDPYVGVLGTSYAYHQIDVDASKLFCNEHLGIDAGFSARVLAERRERERVQPPVRARWLTVPAYRWPCPGRRRLGHGRALEATGGPDGSIGGEVTWRPTRSSRSMAGSYYSLYKTRPLHRRRAPGRHHDLPESGLEPGMLRVDGRIEFEIGGMGNFVTGISASPGLFEDGHALLGSSRRFSSR